LAKLQTTLLGLFSYFFRKFGFCLLLNLLYFYQILSIFHNIFLSHSLNFNFFFMWKDTSKYAFLEIIIKTVQGEINQVDRAGLNEHTEQIGSTQLIDKAVGMLLAVTVCALRIIAIARSLRILCLLLALSTLGVSPWTFYLLRYWAKAQQCLLSRNFEQIWTFWCQLWIGRCI
jgi:hypothetical protein